MLTNRGYTGHEQLDNIGLVHMNARLYDPMLGRFLSPDPMVKYPQSTQGFNRYSYTDNNPLSRVDFSGYGWLSKTWKKFWNNGGREFTAIAAGIALSYINPALGGFVSSYIYSRGDLRVAFMGALSAGAFYGVGTLTSTWSSEVAKVAAHGVTGGIMSELTGGSFKEGFLGSAFAKGFSGPIENYLPDTRPARVFAAAVVGGTASKLGGGSFSNGAMTGAFSRLFNDELHRETEERIKNPRPYKKYLGSGEFEYQSLVDVSMPELEGAGKLLRRIAFLVDAAGITIEQGMRYFQYGTEYDVVLEERLVSRNDNGTITYISDIPTNVYPTDKTKFVPGEPGKVLRETNTRICVGEGLRCVSF